MRWRALLEIEHDLEASPGAHWTGRGDAGHAAAARDPPDGYRDAQAEWAGRCDGTARAGKHDSRHHRHHLRHGGYLRRALDVGASGYLPKDAPSAQLAEAIRCVAAGGRAIDPTLAAEAWTEPDQLTHRERQVPRLSDEGLSGFDGARQLKLSEGRVRSYLSEAIRKLGAANRVEAARIALQRGWL